MSTAHKEGGDWTSSEQLASVFFLTLGITANAGPAEGGNAGTAEAGNAGTAEAGNAEGLAGEDEIEAINV